MDNVVLDNGRANTAAGNGIGLQLGPAMRGGTRMLVQGNQVHGNAMHGIVIADEAASGNQILDNDAADNARLRESMRLAGFVAYDLYDFHLACGDNIWRGNKWGDGYFNPPCAGAFGSGPEPPPATPTTAESPARITPTTRRTPDPSLFVIPEFEIR